MILSREYRKSKIFKEEKKLKKNCIKLAENKILKKQEFLKKIEFVSKLGNYKYEPEFDIYKELKIQKEEMNQKVRTLSETAYNLGYVPYFITFTNPSEFHHKRVIRSKNLIVKNEKYKFNSLLKGLRAGFENLHDIWENFYDNMKEEYKSEMKFIKCYETHESNVIHLHILVFVPRKKDIVKDQLRRIKKKRNVGNIDIVKIGEDKKYKDIKESNQAAMYIMKTVSYISKGFNENDYSYYKFMKGLGYKLGITRWFSYSNSAVIPSYLWKYVYRNMLDEAKEYYLKKAKENKSCYMSEVKKDLFITRAIYNKKDESLKIKEFGEFNSRLKLYVLIEKKENMKIFKNWRNKIVRIDKKYSYNVKELEIYLGTVQIYKKQPFIMKFKEKFKIKEKDKLIS
jgi:hypothetical protein